MCKHVFLASRHGETLIAESQGARGVNTFICITWKKTFINQALVADRASDTSYPISLYQYKEPTMCSLLIGVKRFICRA